MEGKFIAYYRVSTDKQGQSGLGLDAQRAAVMNYLNGGNWKLVGEFTEVESGKHSDRVQLRAAQAACKKHKAKLVIAKLDRLSRNVAFIANLLEAGTDFVAADNPHANKAMVQMMAVFAEMERDAISKRTKEALAAAKARGVKLGNPRLAEAIETTNAARRKAADAFAANVRDHPSNPEKRHRQPPGSRQGPICAWCEDGSGWGMDGGAGERHSPPGRVIL
jgi:DNA invertase Pin-like site-specific DNA recombinase